MSTTNPTPIEQAYMESMIGSARRQGPIGFYLERMADVDTQLTFIEQVYDTVSDEQDSLDARIRQLLFQWAAFGWMIDELQSADPMLCQTDGSL